MISKRKLKQLNNRQRKKLMVGEYTHWAVKVKAKITPTIESTDEYEGWDQVTEALENAKLCAAGSMVKDETGEGWILDWWILHLDFCPGLRGVKGKAELVFQALAVTGGVDGRPRVTDITVSEEFDANREEP